MYVIVKPINAGSVETGIVIATDENLLAIWQVAKPVQKINCFGFAPGHSEVSGMNYSIGFG